MFFRRFFPALAVLALVLSAGNASADKSFQITRFHSEVEIHADGSVDVTESLTYSFNGKFSWANRVIPLRPGDRITGVRVSERGSAYSQHGSESPGTYSVAMNSRDVRVVWHYSARNETRTFDVSYTVTGLVSRYPDIAEYYHKLIGSSDNPAMRNVTARVTFPDAGQTTDNVRVWAHGPLSGTVAIESATAVTAQLARLPRGRFFELRVITPPEVFAGLEQRSASTQLERILAEEAQWAQEANEARERSERRRAAWLEHKREQRERARTYLPIAIAMAVAGLAFWAWMFIQVGKPHEVHPRVAPGQVPSEHPPAVVAQLMRGSTGGPALVATLLDLAERGYLRIDERRVTKSGWFGREKEVQEFTFSSTGSNPGQLLPFEADLLDFVFNTCGDGRTFTLEDVKKTAQKKRTAFRRWFTQWMKRVKEHAKGEGFYEDTNGTIMAANLLIGLAVGATGLFMSIKTDSAAGVPAAAAGFMQLILTAALTRRTEKGQRLMLEWKRFQKHLKGLSRGATTSVTASDWSRYVAIAVIFGMHKELIPHLRVSDAHSAAYVPLWYAHDGSGDGIAGLTDGFSSMISTVSSTMTSASGAGGGASGGGGGGGGGGSAGAG
jgi:uncharacterized membrane protein